MDAGTDPLDKTKYHMLATPTNLNATPGDKQITLTWDAVPSAVRYQLCNTIESIPSFDKCTYVGGSLWVANDTSLTIPNLTNGTAYYFRVISEDASGKHSPASPEVTATPTAVSPPPTTGKLNDTGITTCSDGTTNGLPCPASGFPGQDAESGRDANQATNNDADGHRGFSFTKISSTGAELPASATQWSCVKDNVTGLMWEVKTDDGGLHDKDWTYTWYEPDNSKNGGNAGTPNGGVCGGTSTCDTSSYVQAVKDAGGWCGGTDWRMPTVDELSGLATLDRYQYSATDKPTIDTAYFPNTTSTVAQYGGSAVFWSSSPVAAFGGPCVVRRLQRRLRRLVP